MAYRGENIDFTIKGSDKINLDSMDFKVLVYPDRHYDEAVTVEKSEMTKTADNYYSGTIGYESTKEMPLGPYTIEVLLIEGTSDRSIFTKQGAFPLYESASKSIE